ncbi:type I polyketide synthase, partial [Streptomyces xiaopingdaonensis]|uniref:type I polyketide synthase n=1 Tax=Streptomyces xiaopingdaonensis TaxID=1565415 RepID=UPI000376FCFA
EPGLFIEFSRLRALAPDGRCKPFSADADGFGMAEGAGMLVVERLSDARRLGHRVLAVVRGSAVNQDGASNGLTAPNGPSQQRAIRAALRRAQVPAADVDLLEAHGTGTQLGDPIELQALQATYGRAHSADRPLHLGSVKSNIGHAQAAAGIAGLVKAVQALRHETLPPTLHTNHPTTAVDWASGALRLLAASRPWPRHDRPRHAAVSAFGISGTNAHVVLGEGDPPPEPSATPPAWTEVAVPLVLSAKTPEALRAQAAALHEHLTRHPDEPLHHTARTLARHRTHHAHRTHATGTRTEILTHLAHPTTIQAKPRGIAALYPGQGTQHPAMGRQLAQHFPAYAHALEEAAAHLDPHLTQPLRTLMENPDPTQHAQPLLFAHQYALTRLYQTHGLTPTTLTGHSIGEITAATTAGILTLHDAAHLLTTRAHLMHQLPPHGTMLAIQATEHEVVATLTPTVALAAVNGPRAVVISGTEKSVQQIGDLWRRRGRRTTKLRVSHAFHSPLMNPVLDEFAAVLEGLTFHEPTVPVVPTADSPHPMTSPAYWVDQIRHTVRFHDALVQLPNDDLLLEIGPDAALTPLITTGHTALASARRDEDETGSFLRSLADAHTHGASVDWPALLPPAPPTDLPTYPFQRERYWIPSTPPEGAGSDAVDHPFLTAAVELPAGGGLVLSGRVSPSTDPWLADHAVAGSVLLAGTGFLELACTAARRAGCGHLGELVVEAPLSLPATGSDVQVWVAAPGDGDRDLVIRSREGDGDWVVHATGTLAESVEQAADTSWTERPWPPAETEEIPVEELYEELAARGYAYGPAFRGLRAVWRSEEETYAEAVLPEGCEDMRLAVHPALLDAALHPLAVGASRDVRLPFAFGPTTVHSPGPRALRVRLRTAAGSVRLDAVTDSGEPVLTTEGLVLRTVDTGRLAARAPARVDALRHEVAWQRVTELPPAGPAPGTWLVLATASASPSWSAAPVEDAVTVAFDGEEGRAELAARLPDGEFAGVLCFARRPVELLTAVQALADAKVAAEVWCVTHRADDDPDAAAVWGLGRAAALELPDRWGGLVDVPEERTDSAAARLAGLLSGGGDEDQVRIADDGVFARRLVAAAPADEPDGWQPSGSVLITGGTGSLGAHVARWTARLGGCSVLLVSRQGPEAPGAGELLAELAACGTPARAVAADVADREAMAAVAREAAEGGAPVRAVFHAAGVGAQKPLLETGHEDLRSVMAAKAGGARVLDEVFADAELDAFVLFSSVSGIWGAAGQAAYGAANAALDAVAARRRARGPAAASLAWGPWAGGGMVDAERERQLRRRGLVPLPVADAVAALARSVALGGDGVLVDAAWPRFLPLFTAARPAPLFAEFLRGSEEAPKTAGRFAAVPPAERERALRELVRAEVAAAIGQSDPARVDLDRPLRELGFDSLMSVRLRDRLAAATGVRLPATLAFDHPTSTALTHHLESLLAQVPDEERRTAAATASTAEPVAIVGMACRYPGGVATPEDLWRLVAEGRDAVTGFPTDRGWDLARLHDPDRERTGTAHAREGGFLDDPAGFDADFFGIPPREALAMDPQQRLLLEAAWEAVESAGIVPESLRGTRAGVFAGVMYNDYHSRLGGIPDGLEGILGLANSNSVMSGRISYLLGLEGPAVTVDTACSSSLVALHLACQALRNG